VNANLTHTVDAQHTSTAVTAPHYQAAFKNPARDAVIWKTVSKAESSILLSLWTYRHSTKD